MGIIFNALENRVNLIIVIIIFILALMDIFLKKDLKSQIVSLGVLGTFIGIFMGLQNFNPSDMKNSIDGILIGLKTAFFTSIMGMGVALLLSIFQRLFNQSMDDSNSQERILLDISNKLNSLNRLDSSKDTDNIIGELERLRTIQSDTRDETKKVAISIDKLRENSKKENEALLFVLNTHFKKMNHSLEVAIEKLSKGATEEIINALKQVIEEFNQELQTSFGDNFVKLNESVINLLEWQNNYKLHIEKLENRLQLSTNSIEKSKDSLEVIASKNEDILSVYKQLEDIINIYDRQIQELSKHLETYAHLSSSAENMFSSITNNISHTNNAFNILTSSLDKNKQQLELISNHFKNLGIEIPKALEVSLEQLNRGLTSLTTQFQKDYKETMDSYRNGIAQ